jgi:hypothetical protein
MVLFDACLEQMMEVAYEIRNVTSYVVGSEEDTSVYGYYYNTFLTDLVANPAMTPAAFGADVVTTTLNGYGYSTDTTQSVVDTSKLDALATTLDDFSTTLQLHKADSAAAETYARNNADSYAYSDNKDLWHYAELIRQKTSSADLQSAAANVKAAVEAAVISEAHGAWHANSHGLAIYVPSAGSYDSSYAKLAFARATSWDTWLQNQP